MRAILRGHSVASLRTTGVHEAYPGHHLQLVSANFAPTLARRIAGLPDGGNLLVEGWAFYCEELMDREGFLDDPVGPPHAPQRPGLARLPRGHRRRAAPAAAWASTRPSTSSRARRA